MRSVSNRVGGYSMQENDVVGYIIEYESGELSEEGFMDLFSHLIQTGQCWTLQGHYGRTAQSLIDNGYISKTGEILMYPSEAE